MGKLQCLASGAAFGVMAIFGKLAYDDGATVGTLLAIRFGLAAALFWALLLAGGGARELRSLRPRQIGAAPASARRPRSRRAASSAHSSAAAIAKRTDNSVPIVAPSS